jgi:hypothetical protein
MPIFEYKVSRGSLNCSCKKPTEERENNFLALTYVEDKFSAAIVRFSPLTFGQAITGSVFQDTDDKPTYHKNKQVWR